MSELAALTEQSSALVGKLLALLEQEKQALAQGDAPLLPGIGDQKTLIIGQINTIEEIRARLLGCEPGAAVSKAMTAWLDKHPEQAEIAGNWKKLLDMAREARQLHEINSRLLGMQLRRTNEMLEALTHHASDAPALYDSDGQTAPSSGRKIVDSA